MPRSVESAQPGPKGQTSIGLAPWVRSALRCPVTGEELVDAHDAQGRAVLVSAGARLAYPVRDGVPVVLPHEAAAL